MQSTSALYKSIYSGVHSQEPKIEIYTPDGETLVGSFGIDRLINLSTRRGLFNKDKFCVGSCVSGEIDVDFYPTDQNGNEVDIPRMAMVKVFVRLVSDDGRQSEWIPKGVFFVDTRKKNGISGVLTIHGFDAMLKAETQYEESQIGFLTNDNSSFITSDNSLFLVKSGVSFPANYRDIIEEIARNISVEIDDRTYSVINGSYQMGKPDAYSMREILSFIAAPYCANFCISDEGKLLAVSAIVDETKVIDIGKSAKEIEYASQNDPFSRVILTLDGVPVVTVGDTVGNTLEVETPWQTPNMAQDILNRLGGYRYQPVFAGGCILDPSAELGDTISADGIVAGVWKQTITFGALGTCDVLAPNSEEIDNEYQYISKENRQTERAISGVKSAAAAQEQIVYISARSGTLSPGMPDGWVADVSGDQNKWTVRRPAYSSAFPVLFVATQRMSVGGEVTCTDPLIDDTITVIDGGHITTGSIDASLITVGKLSSTVIDVKTLHVLSANIDGTISASQIDADNLHVKAANIDGVISAGQIDADNIHVKAANIDNKLSASQIDVTDLQAFGATIGGWELDNDEIKKRINGSYYVSLYAPAAPTDSSEAFYLATWNATTSKWKKKFTVTYGGKLTAIDVDLSGKITATSGTIGGVTISGGKLTGIKGGTAGNIATSTITTRNTVSGINTNLGYGAAYGAAAVPNSSAPAEFFVTNGLKINSNYMGMRHNGVDKSLQILTKTIGGETINYLGYA